MSAHRADGGAVGERHLARGRSATPRADISFPEERLRVIYERMGELGFERRPYEEMRARLEAWHDAYMPHLAALVARLLIAPEFRLPPAVIALSYD